MKIKSSAILGLFVALSVQVSSYAQSFPEKCEGVWKGTMYIWSRGAVVDSVDVKLTIIKHSELSNRWIWRTEYLSESMPVIKDYQLVERDSLRGLYGTDEGDGIELKNYLFGNKLYSAFDVDGIMLTSSYELIGVNLIFEVTSGYKIKGKKKEVDSFSFEVLQRVVFSRIE